MKKFLFIFPIIFLFLVGITSAAYSDMLIVDGNGGSYNYWDNKTLQTLDGSTGVADGTDPDTKGWNNQGTSSATYHGDYIYESSANSNGLKVTIPSGSDWTDGICRILVNHSASNCNNGRYWGIFMDGFYTQDSLTCSNDYPNNFRYYYNGASQQAIGTPINGINEFLWYYNSTSGYSTFRINGVNAVTADTTNSFKAGYDMIFEGSAAMTLKYSVACWNRTVYGLDAPTETPDTDPPHFLKHCKE